VLQGMLCDSSWKHFSFFLSFYLTWNRIFFAHLPEGEPSNLKVEEFNKRLDEMDDNFQKKIGRTAFQSIPSHIQLCLTTLSAN
jgi:hypothetical protein